MSKRFGYKQDPCTCFWCGDRLKFTRVWQEPGANLRPRVIEAFARIHELTGVPGRVPVKDPELGWICGGELYPRVYAGVVTVGPRGSKRLQKDGKPGTCEGKDDHFCSGTCAQAFGRRAGELGYRLELNTPEADA